MKQWRVSLWLAAAAFTWHGAAYVLATPTENLFKNLNALRYEKAYLVP